MGLLAAEKKRTHRRTMRVRSAINHGEYKPRICVFRSLKNMYVQLIDDAQSKTLAGSSSRSLENIRGDKKEAARALGREFAAKVKELGIEAAVFDRGPFRYHGRVKALADGLREGGLHI